MRGANECTTLRVSREDSYTKMSLKRLSSHKTANLSNKARAFSIASLVHKEELAARSDDKVFTTERDRHDSPVPRKKIKTLKPDAILEGKELWNCFYRLGTEMIITKTGRRMFPTVRVSFVNLEPDARYAVLLDIVPLDSKRHRYSYSDSAWFVAGEADAPPPKVTSIHPDSPFTGQQLERQVLSFEKVKLTNNRDDKRGNIILNSMHKYQPRIHLIKNAEDETETTDLTRAQTFVFPETTFMAVTSYQNHLITRLKIYSNPFAKGFRDSIRFLGNTERESYLMSNGIQAYENEDGTCFLSSGALTSYGSRDLFSEEFYQVSTPPQWGPWEDLSCCRTNNGTISNSCYPHSIQCAGSSDIYNRGHAWWRYPISHPEDGVLINY